jgi:hypothetical protein
MATALRADQGGEARSTTEGRIMITLTDAQLQETNGIAAEAEGRVPPLPIATSELKIVMATAAQLPQTKRDIFLQRCAAMLAIRGRFTDSDVADVAKLAIAGLIHQSADSAV